MTSPALTVVVPAFNEATRLPASLARILGYAEGREWEVIVVDDGSSDGTAEVARQAGDRVQVIRYQPNRGKGFAVRTGVLASHGRRILISDADLSAPIEESAKLEAAMPAGGVAIGSRAKDPSLIAIRQPAHRQLMGKVFNLFVRTIAMGGIGDTQCGFKLLDGELARRIFSQAKIDRFAFDVEILVLARKAGAEVVEVPVVWNHVAASRVHPLFDSTRMLLDLVRIRWMHR